jgi:hypothetical protein
MFQPTHPLQTSTYPFDSFGNASKNARLSAACPNENAPQHWISEVSTWPEGSTESTSYDDHDEDDLLSPLFMYSRKLRPLV